MKKIVIVGGGTLGHIYPILPVVKETIDKYEYYFIGTKSGLERSLIEKSDMFKDKFFLNMQGFKRKISIYNLKTIVLFLKAYKKGKKILKNINPNLVIGMGGYISGVIIYAAKKAKYKAIIHEQNTVLGLANRFVEKKVDAVFLNFPIERKIKNSIIIGNPRLTEVYKNYRKKEVKRHLLIVGGSRGSKIINDTVIKAIEKLTSLDYKLTLITGTRYYVENEKKLQSLNSDRVSIIPFTNNLITYLQKASVVVSRSGATTLAELIGLRKVTILIPSPNVTNNHQEKNADQLVKNNCAMKISESKLSVESLTEAIIRLETDLDLRSDYIVNMRRYFNYESLESFVEEMEKLL